MTKPPRMVTVEQLDCRLVAHRWPFAEKRAPDIAAHWRVACAKNPALYDGKVLLACRAEESGASGGAIKSLQVDLFETRFSQFLAWRDFGWPDDGVFNCFAMAAVRSSDGAFLLGEMGDAHSCAGEIYFPGGTPDLDDVVAGDRVDLYGSLARELAEEAGLDVGAGRVAPCWSVVYDAQRIACLRHVQMDQSADALQMQVRAHIGREENPELKDAVMIRDAAALGDPRLPAFMTCFLGHALKRANAD